MFKNKVEGSGRKPRLFVDSGDTKSDQGSDDPIAAALAARKRKQGEEIYDV